MLYMVERPAILDCAETQRILAVAATPFDDVVAEIVRRPTPCSERVAPGESERQRLPMESGPATIQGRRKARRSHACTIRQIRRQ